MRKIKQIGTLVKRLGALQLTVLYAVCEDGTLWQKVENSDTSVDDWLFVPGPEEGEPSLAGVELTLEEQAEELNKHTGTFLSEKLREGET